VLSLQQPLAVLPFAQSRALGSLILVDTATHRTSAAVLVRSHEESSSLGFDKP
jgi:sulfate adenylyltransferase subunit 1